MKRTLLLFVFLMLGISASAQQNHATRNEFADPALQTSPYARYLIRYAAAPGCVRTGQVYYDTVLAKPRFCTATGTPGTWASISTTLGTVTSVSGTSPISVATGTTTPVISLNDTAVTPASYTNTNLTVDAKGRITAASNGSAGAPGGSDTQVQFNDSSAFGGDAGLVYNKTTDTLTAGAFAGPLTGNVTGNVSGSSGSTTGNAATVTTNANLTGDVTSTGNATAIASGVIVNADVNASAAIAYSKLALTGAVLNADLAGSIDLTTKVTGILPAANGGTGINNSTRTLTVNTNAGTLAFGAASKTLTINNSMALTGTDSTTMTFPSTSATIARTDAGQTFTGNQVINGNITMTDNTYDIGASGATRPKDVYAAGKFLVGADIALTRASTNVAAIKNLAATSYNKLRMSQLWISRDDDSLGADVGVGAIDQFRAGSAGLYSFSSTANSNGTNDSSICRVGAGILGINDGSTTCTNYRDLNLRNLIVSTAATVNGSLNISQTAIPTWLAGFNPLMIGANNSILGTTALGAGASVTVGQNSYIDAGGTTKYISTDEATRYVQTNGGHTFSNVVSGTAGTAITWTDAFEVRLNGVIAIKGVGVYSPGTPGIAGNATLNADSKDSAGKITSTGTGASTAVLTFATAFTRAPACVVTNETTANLVRPVSTTTTLTVNATVVTSDVLAYICIGY